MKILVTGGTGFIGSHVVQKLLAEGHHVRVMSRRPKSGSLLEKVRPEFFCGNVTDQNPLRQAMEGMEVVVNCVQFPSHPVENPKKSWTYWQVDALGTERQVKAAVDAGVRHFIYMSGAGTGRGGQEPWFKAKAHAEEVIQKSGIPSTILRPSWIYGPDDRSMSRLQQMIRDLPIFPMIGDGQNHVQPIRVEDVAELVAMIVSPSPVKGEGGQIVEVGGPEEMTMDALVQKLCRGLGKYRPIVHIPKALAKLLVWPLKFLSTPPMTPGAIDFVTMDVRIDIGPLQKHFPDFHPRPFSFYDAQAI